jgi:uncharacterized RDD family membrane protein YckC
MAIVYDSIMLFCVVFIAWQPVPALPLDQWPPLLAQGIKLTYLLAICLLFFGWFWTHGGQTIGMRAWRIRVSDYPAPGKVSWKQTLQRFLVALLSWGAAGLGFLWCLFRQDRRAWHDLASSTCLLVEARRGRGDRKT